MVTVMPLQSIGNCSSSHLQAVLRNAFPRSSREPPEGDTHASKSILPISVSTEVLISSAEISCEERFSILRSPSSSVCLTEAAAAQYAEDTTSRVTAMTANGMLPDRVLLFFPKAL